MKEDEDEDPYEHQRQGAHVIVVGSRGFNDYDKMKSVLDNSIYDVAKVISGGARGADRLAERWAIENGINLEVIKADWKTYGKPAGFMRNILLVEEADVGYAFYDGKSKGTAHTISLMKRAGKDMIVIKVESNE